MYVLFYKTTHDSINIFVWSEVKGCVPLVIIISSSSSSM